MESFRYLMLLASGAASRVRILNYGTIADGGLSALASEWNHVADRTDCRTLDVDCSNCPVLGSELLSELLVLQRRLQHKGGALVLSGLRPDVRKVMRWTRLDRLFDISHDDRPAIRSMGVTTFFPGALGMYTPEHLHF